MYPLLVAAAVSLSPPEPDRLRVGAGWGLVHVALVGRDASQALDTRGGLVLDASYAVWRGGPVGILAGVTLLGQMFSEDGSLLAIASEHVDVELRPTGWLHLRVGVGWSEQVGHDAYGIDAGVATRPTLFGAAGAVVWRRIGVELQVARDAFQDIELVRAGALVTVAF